MSNDEYQQRGLFCEDVKPLIKSKMRKYQWKTNYTLFPGVALGISFPMTDYVDCTVCLLFVGIHIKWRKR